MQSLHIFGGIPFFRFDVSDSFLLSREFLDISEIFGIGQQNIATVYKIFIIVLELTPEITRLSSIESQPKNVVVVFVYCCSFFCYCYYFKFSQNLVSNSWDIFVVVVAFVLLLLMLMMRMLMFLLLFYPKNLPLKVCSKSGQ